VGRFDAVSDEGDIYTVVVFQEFTEFRSLIGGSTLPGLQEFRLLDGSFVNQINPETFQILDTDEILRKV
jgi:hypothetical protein